MQRSGRCVSNGSIYRARLLAGRYFILGLSSRYRAFITGLRRCYLRRSSLIIPHFKAVITGRRRCNLGRSSLIIPHFKAVITGRSSLIIPHFKGVITGRMRCNLGRSSLNLSLKFKAHKRSRGFRVTCAPWHFLQKKISPTM
jgi:hypothetical protein